MTPIGAWLLILGVAVVLAVPGPALVFGAGTLDLTLTPGVENGTPVPAATEVVTPTAADTFTPAPTLTAAPAQAVTETSTPEQATAAPTDTPTSTSTATLTVTPLPETSTSTDTATEPPPTGTPVPTKTLPPTVTLTTTNTPTVASDPIVTGTATSTPTLEATATETPGVTLTPTAAPTSTAAVTPSPGVVRGHISAVGRADMAGISVAANPGGFVTKTSSDGSFEFSLPPSTYSVIAGSSGYLPVQKLQIVVASGETSDLGMGRMIPGDANHDGTVGVNDVALVAGALGLKSGFPANADINGDGQVNILDLVLVAANYGSTGPQAW